MILFYPMRHHFCGDEHQIDIYDNAAIFFEEFLC